MARSAGNGCLLVVDDEPEISTAIADYFQRHGYDVDTAWCFSDARALLSTNGYDALITDLNLPDGSGFDLLPLCSRWTGCRAIVISGRMDRDIAARAVEMGAYAALAKPVSLQALKAALQAQSGHAGVGEDTPGPPLTTPAPSSP